MKYEINPTVYRNIFAVPVEVADKHIKLASHASLKVLLYVMRNGMESMMIRFLSKSVLQALNLMKLLYIGHR